MPTETVEEKDDLLSKVATLVELRRTRDEIVVGREREKFS